MDLIRDRIKEIIDGNVFKVARTVLIDKEMEVTEDDDTFIVSLDDIGLTEACLCAVQDYVDLDELTLDELTYTLDTCEDACMQMQTAMTTLSEE